MLINELDEQALSAESRDGTLVLPAAQLGGEARQAEAGPGPGLRLSTTTWNTNITSAQKVTYSYSKHKVESVFLHANVFVKRG